MSRPTPAASSKPSPMATAVDGDQLRLLGAIHDDHTRRMLHLADCEPDTVILDAGAGAGSVSAFAATELLEPTDSGGRVDALDIDPQHLPQHERIRVRAEDITTADLGTGVYDLVHARLLLMHLPTRDDVLRRMICALKPGGRLIISDWDCQRPTGLLQTADPALKQAFVSFQQILIGHAIAGGMSAGWASTIASALLRHGLQLIKSEIHIQDWTGGQPGLQWYDRISRHHQDALLASGMTPEQLQLLRDGLVDPNTVGYLYPLFTAVGIRAAAS